MNPRFMEKATILSIPRTEFYLSVDVEASGPIPGEFGLLSVGACVIGHPDQSFLQNPVASDKQTEGNNKKCK